MYELIQLSDSDFYIQSPAKIGLVKLTDDRVLLIDSGNDKDAGKKVRRLLEANGWTLDAIYSTHSHADHIGGNRYLLEQTGCRLFAPAIEDAFTAHTILEPTFLFGGRPPKELQHKFLMAQPSGALPLTQDVLPEGFSLIDLPGHSFRMAGIRTPDDTVFLADCLSSRETLEKYRIAFLCDPGAYLQTLEQVKTMQAKRFVPSHAEVTEDIAPLAQYNINTVLEIADRICAFCAEPVCFDTLLQKLFAHYGLQMTFEQHALVGSTVRSYLSWLKDTGRLTAEFENNLLLWRQV